MQIFGAEVFRTGTISLGVFETGRFGTGFDAELRVVREHAATTVPEGQRVPFSTLA
jgi:hypothetical protein